MRRVLRSQTQTKVSCNNSHAPLRCVQGTSSPLTLNESICFKKEKHKLINETNDVMCNGMENYENEFPSSRKSRKNCKFDIVKDKAQKIRFSQKYIDEKNIRRDIEKQMLNKENLILNHTKQNCINGKEMHTIKNNFHEALKALENTPIRKSTRLQRKENNKESKNKYRKVFNSIINRCKKDENSEGVRSVSFESKYNKKEFNQVFSEVPMKNCPKFKCNILSPIRENISESYSDSICTYTAREQYTNRELHKNEIVNYNIPEDRLAIYDFEYDENEEPCFKKKQKKRIHKKPKLCSQNLTINKIKYGSTSSLNSAKSKFGSTSSINSVHSEYNCIQNEKKTQVQNNKKPTDSEYELRNIHDMCTSNKMVQIFENNPGHNFSLNGTNDSKNLFSICSPLHNYTSHNVKSSQKHNLITPVSKIHNTDYTNIDYTKNDSYNATFTQSSAQLDCSNAKFTDCCLNNMSYSSMQQSHCNNLHGTLPVSTESISCSTPLKQSCDTAHGSSISDEHESFNSPIWSNKKYDEKDFPSKKYDQSKFFGFDTEESIGEPLLSSTKKNTACSKKDLSCKREIFPANSTTIRDIIQILESEVNQKQKNMFDEKMAENSESCEMDSSLSGFEDNDKPVYFKKVCTFLCLNFCQSTCFKFLKFLKTECLKTSTMLLF